MMIMMLPPKIWRLTNPLERLFQTSQFPGMHRSSKYERCVNTCRSCYSFHESALCVPTHVIVSVDGPGIHEPKIKLNSSSLKDVFTFL